MGLKDFYESCRNLYKRLYKQASEIIDELSLKTPPSSDLQSIDYAILSKARFLGLFPERDLDFLLRASKSELDESIGRLYSRGLVQRGQHPEAPGNKVIISTMRGNLLVDRLHLNNL